LESELKSDLYVLLEADMETMGMPLGEYVDGKIYSGIKTGFNKCSELCTQLKFISTVLVRVPGGRCGKR
jgi:hypothetical protein